MLSNYIHTYVHAYIHTCMHARIHPSISPCYHSRQISLLIVGQDWQTYQSCPKSHAAFTAVPFLLFLIPDQRLNTVKKMCYKRCGRNSELIINRNNILLKVIDTNFSTSQFTVVLNFFLHSFTICVQCLLRGHHPPQCTGAHELRSCA